MRKCFLANVGLLVMLTGLGCGQTKTKTVTPKGANKETTSAVHNYKGRDWCAEHGIPESKCSMCDAKVAAEFKKAGDWCDKHDRAKSQCFVCDPSLKDKFAAEYKAKYGEDPPPIEDEKK